MENGPFTDDFPNKTSIYNGFSIAMLNYQRVLDIEIMDSMFTTEDIFLYLHEFDHGPTVE